MAADTSVKYFHSAMTGAPALNNTAGALIAVLDACLVDGFGLKPCDAVVIAGGVGTATISTGHSAIEQGVVLFAGATSPAALNGERKITSVGTNTLLFDAADLPDGAAAGTITVKLAPAGWVKAFSGTNLTAYKSLNVAATAMLLRVDDTTTTYASVRGYETMTDINTGTGMFPATAQQAHASWPKSNTAAAKPWWIFADDRGVYFCVAPATNYSQNPLIFFFGDIVSRRLPDPYCFCIMSNTVDASAQGGNTYNPVATSGGIATNSGKYLARSYSGIPSPVSVTQSWIYTQGLSGYGSAVFPNPVDNALFVTPMSITEGSAFRGEMPGIFASPQAVQSAIVNGTLIRNLAGLDRVLVYQTAGYSNSNGIVGGVFFDPTGPWSG